MAKQPKEPKTQIAEVAHATLNGLNEILSEEAGEKVVDQKLPQEFEDPTEAETQDAEPIPEGLDDALEALREAGYRIPSRAGNYDIYRKFELLVAGATAADVVKYAAEWVG